MRTAASNGVIDGDLRRRVPHPLPAPRDHAELEREQLVERQPSERGVAALERVRVVGLLDRPGDRHEPLLGDDLAGQVLRVGETGLVERLADRRPEADRGQAAGQPVDRHDPAGVEQLGVLGDDLELGVVEGQLAPEMLDLARHDDLGTDEQPALDEAPAEPGRVDAPGVVLESRDRALGPAAETGLDADVADACLGGDDRAVGRPAEVAHLSHLAQVVVAPRQVEEQVADRVEVELDAGPPQRRAGGQPGPRQRGRQELDRVGRDASRRSLPWPPYSAEIRYR